MPQAAPRVLSIHPTQLQLFWTRERTSGAPALREAAGRMAREGWMDPSSHARTVVVPKVWFAVYSAGTVFLLPFVTILWRGFGFSEELVGVLCALRPFCAALGGSLIVSAADASQKHMAVLLAVYLVAFLGRSLMALFSGFAAQLLIAVLTEAAASPMGALIDASVMASATDDGQYGRIRMWASIGWGGAAPVAGAVVAAYGLKTAFLCFTALVGLALLPTVFLPVEALAAKKAPAGARGPQGQAEGDGESQRLSCLGASSDKLGDDGKGAATAQVRGSADGGGLLSVQISGGSQSQGQGQGHLPGDGSTGGKRAPAPLRHSWSIASSLYPADSSAASQLDGEPAPQQTPQQAQQEAAGPPIARPVIHLVADGRAGRVSLLASPERPLLLGACSPPTSPRPGGYSTSPLEIAPGLPSSSGPAGKGKLSFLPGGAGKCEMPAEAATAGAGAEPSVWQGVRGLLRDVHVVVFLMLALLMGIGNGAFGFLFLFLDELGAKGTLLGLCLTFNCAAEVPVFFFSGPILKRIGVERALRVAMGAYLLRLTAYQMLPLMPSPWFVLPVELLQGLTFALAWSAGTVHVKHIAPPHLRGTIQSIFSGLYTGVGAGLGGLAGGILYGSFGACVLFRTVAVVLAAGWLGTHLVLRAWGGQGPSGQQHGAAAEAGRGQQGEGEAEQDFGRAANERDEGEGASLLQA